MELVNQTCSDLGALDRMSESCPMEVSLADSHDLGLGLESAECSAMHHAAAVAFVRRSDIFWPEWVGLVEPLCEGFDGAAAQADLLSRAMHAQQELRC